MRKGEGGRPYAFCKGCETIKVNDGKRCPYEDICFNAVRLYRAAVSKSDRKTCRD